MATAWDMPTPYPDKTFHTENIAIFADDVAKATDGELTIKIHSAGSLYQTSRNKKCRSRRAGADRGIFPVPAVQ